MSAARRADGETMDVILPDQLPELIASAERESQARAPVSGAGGLARFSQQLRALSSLNTRLICMDSDEPVYGDMVDGVGRVMRADICALYLQAPTARHLILEGVTGLESPGRRVVSVDETRRPAVQAFMEEYLVHVPDLLAAPGADPLLRGFRSLLALPIIGREGPVGVFEFGRRLPGGFTSDELDLASMLVDQMSYQLENLRLVRQLSASRDAVIHGMARLAESRGGDIGGHLDRMCAYSQLLARRLHRRPGYVGVITDEFISTIYRAAALHDIGKVGVPDSILLKPGRLDEDEYAVMKTHAALGADILRELMSTHGPFPMLEMGVEIALNHHEKWDGTGYPHGRVGAEIPLTARIVALADVYDALTSKRVYKEAWSQQDTLEQVRGLSGSHFDPDLVDVFCLDPAELEEIRRRYPD